MEFLADGGNIAIATALPHIFLCCIVYIRQFVEINLSNFLCLPDVSVFGFWMWRPTLAHGVLFLMSAEYSVVMCGASL